MTIKPFSEVTHSHSYQISSITALLFVLFLVLVRHRSPAPKPNPAERPEPQGQLKSSVPCNSIWFDSQATSSCKYPVGRFLQPLEYLVTSRHIAGLTKSGVRPQAPPEGAAKVDQAGETRVCWRAICRKLPIGFRPTD